MAICDLEQLPQNGSGVIMTDLSRFIVERKNRKSEHDPNHNKLCLFGGGSRPGETPRLCLERELKEELIDLLVVSQVLTRATPWRYYPASNEPSAAGECNLWVYICIVSSETLNHWIERLDKADIHQEGFMEVVDRRTLIDYCQCTGNFVASLEIVFSEFLRKH